MHADLFLREAAEIAAKIDREDVERLASGLYDIRGLQGRVFVLGLGGSYENAIHAAADLRKLCDIEAYAPNPAEMSAWINDSGPEYAFSGHTRWLRPNDALLVLSVGGGTPDVSKALVQAVGNAGQIGAPVYAIVGPDGGYTGRYASVVVKIPAPDGRVTPHTEAFQAVIWHALVSHPLLQKRATKW